MTEYSCITNLIVSIFQAKPRLNKLGLDSIVDPRLHGDYPPAVFLDMANLAIMCSLFDKNERPTMRVRNIFMSVEFCLCALSLILLVDVCHGCRRWWQRWSRS